MTAVWSSTSRRSTSLSCGFLTFLVYRWGRRRRTLTCLWRSAEDRRRKALGLMSWGHARVVEKVVE